MIKKIKIFEERLYSLKTIFEETENKPKIGHYVIINLDNYNNNWVKEYQNFIENNIGKIIKIKDESTKWMTYVILYEKSYYNLIQITDKVEIPISKWMTKKSFEFFPKDIITFSENKKDLEILLAAKTYNL